MSISAAPNQLNYNDDQNFDINIDDIYNDFITAIDNIRSYTNTSAISDGDATSAFKLGDPTLASLKQQTLVNSTLQESRCHAFFRIIGFPVISSSFNLYNPGFDIIYDSTRNIGAAVSGTKLSIASNPISGFRNLSLQREDYFSSILNVFSVPQAIDAGALALSVTARLTNVTPFSIPTINNPNGFDMTISDQQYKADLTSNGPINPTNLTAYVDVNGNNPSISNLFPQRTHLIPPFQVDPVIDFTVNDASRLIAVPFAPNKSYLMVKDGVFVNRPIIEQVITDRLTLGYQEDTLGANAQSLINFVKNNAAIQDNSIVTKVNNGVYQLSEQFQFAKFVNIIRTMINALVSAQQIIKQNEAQYYWIPVPSVNGPEGGSTVQGVFYSTNVPNSFYTMDDQAIINAQIKVTLNQINTQVAQISGTPDRGGFSFDNFKTTFGPDTSSALGDISTQSLEKLVSIRNTNLTKANQALRTVEIIMGEFSGLGLCDIIAVMGALYIMPVNSLLGFLDSDALVRANNAIGLDTYSSAGIKQAMSDLTSNVADFYSLMDDLYLGAIENNEQ